VSLPIGKGSGGLGRPGDTSSDAPASVYEAVGGQPFFDDLVARFYRGVAEDPVLRPLYPDDDMAGAERRLALFLGQYWGGPTAYSDERGHPRLRMRHVPFAVGEAERDAWLTHMRLALRQASAAADVHPDLEARMAEYFAMAAEAMVNTR
jgi:hemoglobin